MACVNSEKFYIEQTNSNFKTRFKEQKKDFIYGEGHSNFSNHVIEEGDEMKNMVNIMAILHKENNHEECHNYHLSGISN